MRCDDSRGLSNIVTNKIQLNNKKKTKKYLYEVLCVWSKHKRDNHCSGYSYFVSLNSEIHPLQSYTVWKWCIIETLRKVLN